MSRSSWLAGFVILADWLSKFFVRKQNLLVVENSGLPFGINTPGFFSFVVVSLALLLFLYFYRRYFGPRKSAAWSLIVGGAIANLLDRVPDGKVMDFIDIGISKMNIADIVIFAGIFLLLWQPHVAENLFRGSGGAFRGTGRD